MIQLKVMEPSIEADFEAISTDEEQTTPLPPPDDQGESETTEQPLLQEVPKVVILSSLDEVATLFDRPELTNLGCSYQGTHQRQIWFECETCFPDTNQQGVCLGCAKQCLAQNHDIDVNNFRYGSFYCDKGHQKAGCPKIDGESDEEEEEETEQLTRHGQVCTLI